jgi:hypothetical protein
MLCSLLLVSSVHVKSPSLKIILGMTLLCFLFWCVLRRYGQRSLENPNKAYLLIRKLLLLIFSTLLFTPYFRYSSLIKLKIIQGSGLPAILGKLFSEHKDACWVDGFLSSSFFFIYLAFFIYLWILELSNQEISFTLPEGTELKDLDILEYIAEDIKKEYPNIVFELLQIKKEGKDFKAVFQTASRTIVYFAIKKAEELNKEKLNRDKFETIERERDLAEKMLLKQPQGIIIQAGENSNVVCGNNIQQQNVLPEAIHEIKKTVESEPNEIPKAQNTLISWIRSRLNKWNWFKEVKTGFWQKFGDIVLIFIITQVIPKAWHYMRELIEYLFK